VAPSILAPSVRIRRASWPVGGPWTRLYVDLAAAEKRSPLIRETELNPYSVTIHAAPQPFKVLFEVRPRAGVWHPFAAGVPNVEKERVGLTFRSGARGFIPAIAGIHISGGNVISDDGAWYLELGPEAASPTQSYVLFCKEIPSALAFGQINTPGQMYFWRAAENVSHAGHRKSPNGIVKVASSLDDANGPAR
jgi:hypothetical protein